MELIIMAEHYLGTRDTTTDAHAPKVPAVDPIFRSWLP